jgi:hypothetical protein
MNIQKRELCVKGIVAQDLGFVCGLFIEGSARYCIRSWEKEARMIRQGRTSSQSRVFHGCLFFRPNALAAENLESGMTPRRKRIARGGNR